MKRKRLIVNDIGLARDKVTYLLEEMDSYGGELYGDEYKEVFIEIMNHLEQSLDNLGEED